MLERDALAKISELCGENPATPENAVDDVRRITDLLDIALDFIARHHGVRMVDAITGYGGVT